MNIYFVLASYMILFETKSEYEAHEYLRKVKAAKMAKWLKKSGIDPSNCSAFQKKQIADSLDRINQLFRVLSLNECKEKCPDIYEYHVVCSILEHTADIPEENQVKEEKVS